MDKVMDESTRRELRRILSDLKSDVRLVFFTRKEACPACSRQEGLLRELCSLSDRLKLEVCDLVLDGDKALNYRIDKTPATAVLGEKDHGIRFYGLTAGNEFSSLLEAMILVSGGRTDLGPELERRVREISQPVHIQVMTTLTCPYCPSMVHIAHEFAFLNENIRADMVEIAEFPELAQKHQVTGVPKTIINETHSFNGALPATAFYVELMKAVDPEKYADIVADLRRAQGEGKATEAREGHIYELAIVGGGPAAMSAAIYAARKAMDVALIAKKLGGQITYTADIENYLGMDKISGAEMAETFRWHMESNPIAEALGSGVAKIERNGREFILTTQDGRVYKALSVVYCAGKEYRRLDIPGEERFIGKGIGFCATCDAPLYKGKRVAVVGGGNSAFTSVRDLVGFAAAIHLIHRRADFRADKALVEEVVKSPSVTVHAPMEVREYLGTELLRGIRLESPDGKTREELAVDGVFLEIGLSPNSEPLKGLAELTGLGEVKVDRFQKTSLEGLFAAGDVTDTEEKQISVAVGQGAQAALSAYKFLSENKLTSSRISRKEAWQ